MIEKQFDPDRAILSLEFKKKQAKKTSDKKQAKKNKRYCRLYWAKYTRTREIIAEMDDVTGAGGNSNKTYHLI